MSTKPLTVGETGRIIRANAGRSLVDNTELTLTFIKPDLSVVTKTKASNGVVVGTVDVTDEDLGELTANEYVEYPTETGFLDQDGKTWTICLSYDKTTESPPHHWDSVPYEFEVLKACGDPT